MNYFQLPHSNYNAESGVKPYGDTITTELYCDDVIEDMPYTCKNNLEKAKSKKAKKEGAVNARPTADAAYQQIVAHGYILGCILPNKKERKIFCWVDNERLFHNAQSWDDDEIINQRMVNIDWDAENGNIEERTSRNDIYQAQTELPISSLLQVVVTKKVSKKENERWSDLPRGCQSRVTGNVILIRL
jgi:hypothetical protein